MMKQRKLFSVLCAMIMMLVCIFSYPVSAEETAKDSELFTIIDGTYLESYNGTDLETVVVPDGIQVIGEKCFWTHMEIRSVILPESVVEIEDYAFYGTGLTEVTLPDSVRSIGEFVFGFCQFLTDVTLSDALRVLPSYAFFNCLELRSVVGGENLESIKSWCFWECAALSTLRLGDQIVEFETYDFEIDEGGFDMFQHNRALMEAYRTDEGFVNVEGKYLLRYDGYDGVVFVPDGTRMLLDYSLANQNYYSLILPNSVRYINTHAIANCSRLMQLYLNDGLLSIGENALSGCDLLTTLVIPESVTYIGAQENCFLTDIYGMPGTAAETFANENGITFHDLTKPEPVGTDNSIIYGVDTWSIRNSSADFNGEYYLTDAARAQLREIMAAYQDAPDGAWTGECYGLSITMILMKAGVYTPSQIQPGANTVSEITSDQNVQSFLNYYHFTQNTKEMLALSTEAKTDAQIMYRTMQAAKAMKNGGMPFLISLTFKDGGHAYVGYGQEDGEWEFNGKNYDGRILIWDPNFPTAPNENTYIYYDSLTFEYCIPYYNAVYTIGSVGPIKRICSDIDLLNMYPYPFTVSELAGDVNCDGSVELADAVLLARAIAGEAALSVQGTINGDVDGVPGLSGTDFALLLKALTGSIVL